MSRSRARLAQLFCFFEIACCVGARVPETLSSPPSEPASDTTTLPQLRKDLYLALCLVAAVNVLCFAFLWNSDSAIDFRAFYCAGRIAFTSPSQVYSVEAQRFKSKDLPGQNVWMPYYHPPIELLLFAPLARLPYRQSLALWTAISAASLLVSIAVLASFTSTGRRRLLIIALALFSTYLVLHQGQDTFLLLLLLCLTLSFVQRKQDVRAGIVLAVALFKPQVPLVLALALLLRGRRKLIASFSVSSGLIGFASLAAIGSSGVGQFVELIRHHEPLEEAWRMVNLRGLLSLVHAPRPVTIAVSILVLAAFAIYWYRAERPLLHVASSAILAGALLSYHFHAYDLALLLIPITYLVSNDLSRIEWAALFCLAAAPVFFLLIMNGAPALLAIAVLVLALHPAIQTWRRSAPAAL